MTNNQLPADVQARIKADAEDFKSRPYYGDGSPLSSGPQIYLERGYIAGATAESERAQVLVDALDRARTEIEALNKRVGIVSTNTLFFMKQAAELWKQGKGSTLKKLDFGSYCWIEQKRFGRLNEMYQYKVIGRLESNKWIDVPVEAAKSNAYVHEESEDILLCICVGVCEEKVERFRVKDISTNPPK